MRTLFHLTAREVKSFFYSPIAYVMLVIFLALNGVAFYYAVQTLTKIPADESVVFVTFFSPFFVWPFILIMPPSIFISWISTIFATGEAAATSAVSAGDFSCMNAPVAFCPVTVPRTHGSVTVT